ncbi:hypothetical protein LIER_27304 [Lithospermum erythrorhizon]|uniref:Uncharacterized protein n=1 Tax=Lithospermum erythrorhizon TaxID=34254 RepID=A0AAV3RCR6_LITER
MEEFKSCIDALDVTELAGHGQVFTWCSNWASRDGHLRKLDHVFCNLEWVQCLPQSYVHVQPPEVSDHCLLSIHLKNGVVTEELREVQEQIYNGAVTSELMCKERNLREVFAKYSRAEMELFKSKARATYLEKGDFSTSFFHRSVVAYTQRQKISMIEDGAKVCHQDPVEVEGVIVQFYKDLFTSKGPLSKVQKDVIRRTVTARVPVEDWAQLVAVPGLEEVKEAFQGMASGKSPGPDGFSTDFYKHNWEVVGEECEYCGKRQNLQVTEHGGRLFAYEVPWGSFIFRAFDL